MEISLILALLVGELPISFILVIAPRSFVFDPIREGYGSFSIFAILMERTSIDVLTRKDLHGFTLFNQFFGDYNACSEVK